MFINYLAKLQLLAFLILLDSMWKEDNVLNSGRPRSNIRLLVSICHIDVQGPFVNEAGIMDPIFVIVMC